MCRQCGQAPAALRQDANADDVLVGARPGAAGELAAITSKWDMQTYTCYIFLRLYRGFLWE